MAGDAVMRGWVLKNRRNPTQGRRTDRVTCPKLNVCGTDPLPEGMKVKAMGEKQLSLLIVISTGWQAHLREVK